MVQLGGQTRSSRGDPLRTHDRYQLFSNERARHVHIPVHNKHSTINAIWRRPANLEGDQQSFNKSIHEIKPCSHLLRHPAHAGQSTQVSISILGSGSQSWSAPSLSCGNGRLRPAYSPHHTSASPFPAAKSRCHVANSQVSCIRRSAPRSGLYSAHVLLSTRLVPSVCPRPRAVAFCPFVTHLPICRTRRRYAIDVRT